MTTSKTMVKKEKIAEAQIVILVQPAMIWNKMGMKLTSIVVVQIANLAQHVGTTSKIETKRKQIVEEHTVPFVVSTKHEYKIFFSWAVRLAEL